MVKMKNDRPHDAIKGTMGIMGVRGEKFWKEKGCGRRDSGHGISPSKWGTLMRNAMLSNLGIAKGGSMDGVKTI